MKSKRELLKSRHKRILKNIRRGNEHIRLRITKTNSHVYAQALDDAQQRTIASSSSLSLKLANGNKENCILLAKDLSKRLKELNIDRLVLDRGGHKYHGRIAVIADVLREEGIKI
ncbi:ribosomal protein L18 [Mycoplasma haemofelis str. Langford 1]|uniref:Large ribosomal subunit protein uL18 n=2 Tax=Mycoplasma haemofelis TaxID=29501 RepID=F6FHC0_MYCHI|nr:50S ribosomal protein L18 [Mycoplasma haemofelis]AEG73750.1 50S ribosomal L18 [Mycoplasma haemofelis Ohio2]CBY93454.1 ribosomal protein L18 [Mycoplasma haemofelis str. Langford 1]